LELSLAIDSAVMLAEQLNINYTPSLHMIHKNREGQQAAEGAGGCSRNEGSKVIQSCAARY